VKTDRTETYLGFLILLVLLMIAASILVKQSRYDERLFTVALSKHLPAPDQRDAAGTSPDLQDYLPDGMVVLTSGESFGAENLSEKIDGKAELYLAAGFLSLRTQRFAEAGQPAHWLELFVYDMGNRRNAFSVFSTQRRADAQDAAFSKSAYLTENALFFQQGPFYVEIIGTSEQMVEGMLAIGENFTRKHPAGAEGMNEVALFPAAALIPGSIALLAENVFGFDRLNHTFVGRYRLAETELTAFLAPQLSEVAAKELAFAYHQFLLENGGEDAGEALPIPDAWLVKVFDIFELVFVHGSYLAGVHEAETRELAEALALNLKDALAESAP
jgi:hypothetical protein